MRERLRNRVRTGLLTRVQSRLRGCVSTCAPRQPLAIFGAAVYILIDTEKERERANRSGGVHKHAYTLGRARIWAPLPIYTYLLCLSFNLFHDSDHTSFADNAREQPFNPYDLSWDRMTDACSQFIRNKFCDFWNNHFSSLIDFHNLWIVYGL